VTPVRGLYLVAAALLVAGLGLRLAPTPLPRVQAAPLAVPAELDPNRASTSARPVPAYNAIIAANIFSPDRTPPAVRLSLVGRVAAPTKPREPTLRLYGITVGAQGAVALIDADPNIPGAEIYRVGDLVAGARVLAITDSTVTLAEPSGPLVLHLRPAQRRSVP
jgi:hypothetical protein